MASRRNDPVTARSQATADKQAQTQAWQAWRITDGRFDPFSAVGASLVGGHWNSPGLGAIYASRSYAGAMLECLAHAGIGRVPRTHVAVEIAISEAVTVERHDDGSLPSRWDDADLRGCSTDADRQGCLRPGRVVRLRVASRAGCRPDTRVKSDPPIESSWHGSQGGDRAMAIPDFQSLMLPVLKESAAGEVRISDVVAVLGTKLALTEAELSELLPSGKQTTFANRVNWAKSYLGKAGLIRLTKRAYFEISERGRTVLANPPQTINIKFLESFPGFKAFREAAAESPTTPQTEPPNFKELAPDEVIRSASDELQQSLSAELLAKILASPPDFFERLVVQLLIAMGYGGSAIEAGKALGKSGDGGVDGVIDQDALGLDRIYVQAKRYTDNKVSSGEIRDFFGSLDRFKANKGLFVTTSTFSPAAKETADMLSKRIVLIDGMLLTRLMIRFDIGCRVEEVVYIKKLDEDFFD